jgi:4-amino-4-deoxy-L-arabinose transferase-like glycosyltransferase
MNGASANREGRRDAVILLALGVALFLPGLAAHDLWNPDEPRYAEVAREMLQSGEYLVPHFNGQLYTQKPPLLFWAMCLVASLFGRLDEWTIRLPSLLAGVLTLPLIGGMGRRLFSRRAGLLAALVFGTCLNITTQVRSAQIDAVLFVWVTLAMWAWVRAETEKKPAWIWLFWFATGMATLAKGPVGLLPPLLSILACIALLRDREALRRLRIARGLVVWALVVGAWLIPALLHAGREYFDAIVLRQNIERFINPWGHRRPWYYYLAILPTNFFPWFFFLPSAAVFAWRRLDTSATRLGLTWSTCWVVVTVIFFSLSPGKRTVYILTMYPAMALLIGAGMDRLIDEAAGLRRCWLTWPSALLSAIAIATAVGLPWWGRGQPALAPMGPGYLRLVSLAVLLLAAGALAATVLSSRRRTTAALASLFIGVAAFSLVFHLHVRPPFDALKSAQPMALRLSMLAAPDEPYGIFPRVDAAFVFYTGRFAVELRTEEGVREFAARPGRVWLLVGRRELERFDPPLPLVEVARDLDPIEGHILLTKPPATKSGSSAH